MTFKEFKEGVEFQQQMMERESKADRVALYPEAAYGGDGPWNDHGGEGESVYIQAAITPTPVQVAPVNPWDIEF